MSDVCPSVCHVCVLYPHDWRLTFLKDVPGSWFIPRQRCIGRRDSSSSSCPLQPLQSRPNWCPFSLDLSWRHLSSSVAVDMASSWNPRVNPTWELVAEVCGYPFLKDVHVQAISDVCMIISSSFGSAVASVTFSFVTLSFQEIPRILSLPSVVCCFEFFFHLCDWDWPQLCTVEQRREDKCFIKPCFHW